MNPERHVSTQAIAALALAAAVLQLLANVALGLSRAQPLALAALEGPRRYILAVALTAGAVTLGWALRRKPWLALSALALSAAGLYFYVRPTLSRLGLAYHGELIAYHFTALIAAALCLVHTTRWARRADLGPVRFAPLALTVIGVASLLFEHLTPEFGGEIPGKTARALGRATMLTTWPLAVAVFWRFFEPSRLRFVPLILAIVVTLRVAVAGGQGLLGGPVEGTGADVLGASIIVGAVSIFFLFRPRLELWVRLGILAISALAAAFFLFMYFKMYGRIEDGLNGVLRSLLGFDVPLPYPGRPGAWKPVAVMVGAFFMFATIYNAIVSTPDRPRGVALALFGVAGLNLFSPYLVLLLCAGALSFVDTLFEDPQAAKASDVDADGLFADLAERLDFGAPLAVATGRRAVVALSGEIDKRPVDLRARAHPRGWDIEVAVGTLGNQPIVELLPDAGDGGQRPPHLISRSHRVTGDVRHLERVGDRPLDALSPFRTARLRLWDAGAQAFLGRDLSRLGVDELESIVRALVAATK